MKERPSSFKTIMELSKSGIVTLVLISVFAGYLIGQPGETLLEFHRMVLTLLGVLFLASGSSALNQIQERKIDAQMPRTASRPLPSGRLSLSAAVAFTLISIALGLILLAYLDSQLFILGILAVLSYNGLYTMWWKKRWAYAAVPGAIPGALPILMGHVAVTHQLWHPGGIYLFFILFFWQMPHFWALALRYQEDYQKGGFPVLPLKHGSQVTLKQIGIWCVAYLGLAWIAPFFLKVKWIYLIPSFLMGVMVTVELLRFAKNPESKLWLRFFLWVNFSLVVFLLAAVLDLWSIYIPIPHITR